MIGITRQTGKVDQIAMIIISIIAKACRNLSHSLVILTDKNQKSAPHTYGVRPKTTPLLSWFWVGSRTREWLKFLYDWGPSVWGSTVWGPTVWVATVWSHWFWTETFPHLWAHSLAGYSLEPNVSTKSIEIDTPITLSYGTGLTGVISTLLGNESWLIRALESVSKNW